MSISFSTVDLINLAIGIEKRGIVFYDVMARSTENDNARDVFQHLTSMEREHIIIFQGMLDGVDKYQETLTGDYAEYLQALVDNAVFNDDLITSEIATQADSDLKALELAISAEKDSIIFYYEMRELMPQSAHPIMKKIIAEEKSHLMQLSGLKRKLATI